MQENQMLRGQGLKVAGISLVALLLGVAAEYYRHKVNHDGIAIACVCALFQLILTCWACFIIARAKNLSSNWGFMGIIGLFGVAVLLFIPAKKEEDMSEQSNKETETPPEPIT